VLSGLDVVRIAVKVQKILPGLRIAKEYTGPRIWRVFEGEEARRTHGSGRYGGETDPVKDQNRVSEVSSPDHGHVVESEEKRNAYGQKRGPVMHQRVWHGSNSNVSMGTLDGPIMMGQLGSHRLDCVACLSKEVKDFLAATKFFSTVHPNIFGSARRSGTIGDEHLVSHLMG
jgi:hypothetical protein